VPIEPDSPQNRVIEPPGYTYKGRLFGDMWDSQPEWRILLWANLLALIPLAVVALVVWLPYQFYLALGAPLVVWPNPGWPAWAFWLIGAVVIVGSMLLHEALHGVGLLLQGHQPRFGFNTGYLYASICDDDYLTRREYLVMILLPILVITLAGALILPLLPPSLGQIVLIAILLNAAASIGDLTVARFALRYPPDALFADQHGIQVFTR
jgi:hypothetical protein